MTDGGHTPHAYCGVIAIRAGEKKDTVEVQIVREGRSPHGAGTAGESGLDSLCKDKAELQHNAPRTGGSRMVPRAAGRLPELQQPAGFLWGQRPAQLWLCLVLRAGLPALPSGHMPRVTLLELQVECSFEFVIK